MKDAFYFSHDSNARHDPKILSMISVYGMAGYGWYWVIIEILREQEDYKFSIVKEHSYNAIAMQLYIDCNAAKKFIDDCINEFELFVSDGQNFWSESLLERMQYFAEVKRRRIEAGRLGGLKAQEIKAQIKQTSSNAQAMLKQTSSNAQANKVNKSKVNKSKVKENINIKEKIPAPKIDYADYVSLTEEEYQKLIIQYGEKNTKAFINKLNAYKGANGKKYKSDYLAILSWVIDEILNKGGVNVNANRNTKRFENERLDDSEKAGFFANAD